MVCGVRPVLPKCDTITCLNSSSDENNYHIPTWRLVVFAWILKKRASVNFVMTSHISGEALPITGTARAC